MYRSEKLFYIDRQRFFQQCIQSILSSLRTPTTEKRLLSKILSSLENAILDSNEKNGVRH
jgi:hypothetical protein